MRMKLNTPLAVLALMLCAAGSSAQQAGSGQQVQTTQRRAGARHSPEAPDATPKLPLAIRVSERALQALVGWRLERARNILDENQEDLGGTPEFKTALGYLKACEGEYVEAVDLLTAAKAARPTDPAPAFYLGEVRRWQRQHDDARAAWNTAFDRARALTDADEKDARGHYYLAAAQVRRENLAAARTALTAAGEAGFDPALVAYQTGLTETLDKKWQQAVAIFNDLAKMDPKFAYLYFYRGVAWGKQNRKDLMLIDMEMFLALAPDAPEADAARTYLSAK